MGGRRAVSRAAGVLLLAACAGGDGEAWPGTIAREGGTVVVRNPAEPLLPDGSVVAERVWVVPQDAANEANAAWGRPFDVVVRADTAFVLDVRRKQVHVVALDGRWVRSFGREGNGPGELRMPSGLVPFRDSLAIFDLARNSLQLFSHAGVPGGVVTLPEPYAPFVRALPDGGLLLQRLALRSTNAAERWRRMDASERLAPFALPSAEKLGPGTAMGDSTCVRLEINGGAIMQYGCTRPELRVVEATGVVSRRFGLPGSEAPVTSEAERDSFRRRSAATLDGVGMDRKTAQTVATAQAAALQRPRFWGAARDSATGIYLLWEQNSSAPGDVGALVHVFSPDGIYLARHRFPEPWRLMLFV